MGRGYSSGARNPAEPRIQIAAVDGVVNCSIEDRRPLTPPLPAKPGRGVGEWGTQVDLPRMGFHLEAQGRERMRAHPGSPRRRKKNPERVPSFCSKNNGATRRHKSFGGSIRRTGAIQPRWGRTALVRRPRVRSLSLATLGFGMQRRWRRFVSEFASVQRT